MSEVFARAVLMGAHITLTADCYPFRGNVRTVRVSMDENTGSGCATLNRTITVEGKTLEQVETEIKDTVKEMAECMQGSLLRWRG